MERREFDRAARKEGRAPGADAGEETKPHPDVYKGGSATGVDGVETKPHPDAYKGEMATEAGAAVETKAQFGTGSQPSGLGDPSPNAPPMAGWCKERRRFIPAAGTKRRRGRPIFIR